MPALVAALVVQDLLDDVGRDADVRHACGNAAPDIMKPPRFHVRAQVPVEHGFAKLPLSEARCYSSAKQAVLRGGINPPS